MRAVYLRFFERARAGLLAVRVGEGGHPAPERAARTGLLAAALTLEYLHLHEPEVAGVRAADPELPRELAAMIVGYLGGDPRRVAAPAT